MRRYIYLIQRDAFFQCRNSVKFDGVQRNRMGLNLTKIWQTLFCPRVHRCKKCRMRHRYPHFFLQDWCRYYHDHMYQKHVQSGTIWFYAGISYINPLRICSSHFTGQTDQPNDITILASIAFSHEVDRLCEVLAFHDDFPHGLLIMLMIRYVE